MTVLFFVNEAARSITSTVCRGNRSEGRDDYPILYDLLMLDNYTMNSKDADLLADLVNDNPDNP